MKGMLIGAWNYRHFIFSSVRSEFRASFARSRLGMVWMILRPLAQVTIYALILSAVLSAKLPGVDSRFAYALYLTAGMMGWSLFSEIVMRCLTIFIDNGNLLKKIIFPRICLPLTVTGVALTNSLLLLVAVLLIFLLLGHMPGWTLLWLPLIVIHIALLALGVGIFLGILNVFMRDVGQVVGIGIQFWFWFTPIVYMPEMLPEAYRHIINLNPLYPAVAALQNILVFQKPPPVADLLWVSLFVVVLLSITLHMFRRASSEMVDVL